MALQSRFWIILTNEGWRESSSAQEDPQKAITKIHNAIVRVAQTKLLRTTLRTQSTMAILRAALLFLFALHNPIMLVSARIGEPTHKVNNAFQIVNGKLQSLLVHENEDMHMSSKSWEESKAFCEHLDLYLPTKEDLCQHADNTPFEEGDVWAPVAINGDSARSNLWIHVGADGSITDSCKHQEVHSPPLDMSSSTIYRYTIYCTAGSNLQTS